MTDHHLKRLASVHKISEIEIGMIASAWPVANPADHPCLPFSYRSVSGFLGVKTRPVIDIWFELICDGPLPQFHYISKTCHTPKCRSPLHHQLVDVRL